METIRDRFIKILDELYNGNQSQLASNIGLTQGHISNIVNRGSKPSSELVAKTIEVTNISAEWLLTGKGPMFKSDTQPSTIGNGNIVGNTANNSNIISTNANGNNNKVQTSIGGENKETGKEVNKLKLEISKLKAEIERLNERNAHLMENMQVKDDLIASLKAMIEVLQGK